MRQPKPAPAERTDNPALVFSAAQQDQTAKEIADHRDCRRAARRLHCRLDQGPEVLPADAPASVVYQQVNAELEGNGIADQTPSLDAAGTASPAASLRWTAAEAENCAPRLSPSADDGTIVLDTGRLAGIGPGSTFVSFGAEDKSKMSRSM